MRYFLFLLLFSTVCACNSSSEDESVTDVPKLNGQLLELVKFVDDSLAACTIWLAEDKQRRNFFREDSAADILTEHFTHDQIIEWFQSLDTTDKVAIRPYLAELKLPTVAHQDSIASCASTINAIAFSHAGTEAILLYVLLKPTLEETYTLLLERASHAESWYVADTLSHEISEK
jgi:hypothetical protein